MIMHVHPNSIQSHPSRAREAARFWSKVDTSAGLFECWPWVGSRWGNGYGLFGAGWTRLAHRVAYALTHGPIPDGLEVMHSCDNPPCCNPAHLSIGTHTDNMRDAARKGRLRQQRRPPMTPEERREYMRAYWFANRDKLAAYRAAWYRASPRGQAAAEREAERIPKAPPDPEVLRERRHRWYLEHRDEQIERAKRWYREHREAS